MVAHPPCTYLTVTGNRWFNETVYGGNALTRYRDRVDGIQFFMNFVYCNAKSVAIENPVGIMSGVYRKPDQVVQPYEYGDPSRKATCLWLRNLPLLQPTDIVEPEIVTYTRGDGRKVTFTADYGVGFNTEHGKRRSKTYPGVAKAMSEQWG